MEDGAAHLAADQSDEARCSDDEQRKSEDGPENGQHRSCPDDL